LTRYVSRSSSPSCASERLFVSVVYTSRCSPGRNGGRFWAASRSQASAGRAISFDLDPFRPFDGLGWLVGLQDGEVVDGVQLVTY
jgi:hypothetical protein